MKNTVSITNIQVALSIVLQHFIDKIFKKGSLITFDLEIIGEKRTDILHENLLEGFFSVAFSQTHHVDFGCKLIIHRDMDENYCWALKDFLILKYAGFDDGREIDFKLSPDTAPDKLRKLRERLEIV